MFCDCELRSMICILYIIPYIISERLYNVNDVALVLVSVIVVSQGRNSYTDCSRVSITTSSDKVRI